MGTDFNDVEGADTASDEFIANPNDNNYPIVDYNAAGLLPETTYYWRIDALDTSDVVIGSAGEVWWFTTGPNDYNYGIPDIQFFPWHVNEPNVFNGGSIIQLWRPAEDGNYVVVDSSIPVPGFDATSGWLQPEGGSARSFQRDITRHKCIRRLWDDSLSDADSPTLGYSNSFEHPDSGMIQAHPYLEPIVYGVKGFKNIGEIGMVFSKPAYYRVGDDPCMIGYSADADTEEEVRINLADPSFQQIFDYLTVFDPSADLINNDGDLDSSGVDIIDEFDDPCNPDGYPELGDELKIPGRININTAPWYVIAQLPWVNAELAQAIVAYRDKLQLLSGVVDYSTNEPMGRGTGMVDVGGGSPPAVVREVPGFASIAELLNVTHDLAGNGNYNSLYDIRNYGRDVAIDQSEFPDLTPADGAADDLEERDLIFARISNLVTVRSDVFTAYILIRIGTNGPQKRVIAILDRSNVYADEAGGVTGSVRVRALHPVPDPR
jgi:hypothetical protein